MLLVVFLALKNTPLAFLTSWSYERLNVLHQVSGSMTLIHVILHVSLYCSNFIQSGRPSRLLYTDEIFGMVAALCFLGLAFSGIVVRRWWYELFYYMHICFWTVGVAMVGLHQPELSKKIIFVTCVTGGIWGMDRLLRLTRILMYSVSNEVTLQPLSNGGTRVTLKKPPVAAMSGKHCFLWIPKIRSFEAHPFTIAATDPMEFVIASYDGFTNELHQYATRHPGVSLKASVDGSYGTFPAVDDCDKMILVAGGSGASFTFGTALNALQKMKADDKKTIIFIWIVKQHCGFSPIHEEMDVG
jgi:predicted ferric reductase